jgi:hypothetical protein
MKLQKEVRARERADERDLRLLAWGAARQIKTATHLFEMAVDPALDSDAQRNAAEGAKTCWLIAGVTISRLNPSVMLRLVADALDAMAQGKKLKDFLGERYDDKTDEAFNDIVDDETTKISGRWDPGSLKAYKESLVAYRLYDPYSLREFKTKLARIYGLKGPKELTKLKEYKKELKDSSDKKTKLFDSSLRRTLKRRGHPASGKPGRPKNV